MCKHQHPTACRLVCIIPAPNSGLLQAVYRCYACRPRSRNTAAAAAAAAVRFQAGTLESRRAQTVAVYPHHCWSDRGKQTRKERNSPIGCARQRNNPCGRSNVNNTPADSARNFRLFRNLELMEQVKQNAGSARVCWQDRQSSSVCSCVCWRRKKAGCLSIFSQSLPCDKNQ